MLMMCTLFLILFFLWLLMVKMIAITNFSFEQNLAFGRYLFDIFKSLMFFGVKENRKSRERNLMLSKENKKLGFSS